MEEKEENPDNSNGAGSGQDRGTVSSHQPMRSNLVDLAVKFLNNPRVIEKPAEEKKSFLRKKGLTDAEIERAVNIAAQQARAASGSITGPVPSGNAPPPPPRPLTPLQQAPRSRSWSEYAVMAAVLGGVGYAVIHLIKNYLVPWFTTPSAQEQKLEEICASVNQLQSTMSETITSLSDSTRSIQALLSEQQQHVQLLTSQVTGLQSTLSQHTQSQPLKQLKEELGSLKGILLSRHQFPATPNRGGVANGIPNWQRAANPLEASSTPSKKLIKRDGPEGDAKVNETATHSEENQNEIGENENEQNGNVTVNGDEHSQNELETS